MRERGAMVMAPDGRASSGDNLFKPHRVIKAAFEIDAARIFHFE
jgi:hypothetical protein